MEKKIGLNWDFEIHYINLPFCRAKGEDEYRNSAMEILKILESKLALSEIKIIEYDAIGFEPIPIYGLGITIMEGAISIWSETTVSKRFIDVSKDGCFDLRNRIFDIANAFNEKQAWHFDGMRLTPYGVYCSIKDLIKDRGLSVSRIDEHKMLREQISNTADVLHDSFEDCLCKLEELKRKCPGYDILGLSLVGNQYYRALFKGKVVLLDKYTLSPFDKVDYDEIYTRPNWIPFDEYFALKVGMRYAIFHKSGKQVAPFEKKIDWSKLDNT